MINNEKHNLEQDLNALIQQAELMQKKMQMNILFKKNMEFLKKSSSKIYERMEDFKPESIQLYLDDKGINLINKKSGNPVYNQDAMAFAKEQVKSALLSPSRFSIDFKETDVSSEKHIHPNSVNSALNQYRALGFENHYNPNDPIGLLVILGCGAGYHIKELIDTSDVRNILIYDRIDDGFYASLYTIDWEEIVTEIHHRKGKIKIFTGLCQQTALKHMRALSQEIGLHNMVNHRLLKHTDSKDNDIFYDAFKIEYPIQISAMGFYDDERVSFSHTIHNMNSNLPMFSPKKSENLPPVFLVGNGPSIDNFIDIIKDNRENIILVSCGSAITTLYELGIKPDIHVEVERNLGVAEMISLGTDLEYTKSIPLLAVNNVSPVVMELFSEAYIAIKPNDLGSAILEKTLDKEHYHELPLCNPTVTNCGFSFVLELGFEEVYLIGTDYGMPDKNSHHSKHSIWRKMDERIKNNEKLDKEAIDDYTYGQNQFEVKGNFLDTVITNPILNTSRINIEMCLREKNIICYNPNNGAYIEGTTTIENKDISVTKKIDNKESLIKDLLNKNFKVRNFKKLTEKQAFDNHIALIYQAKDALIFSDTCFGMNDLHKQMDRIFQNLEKISLLDKATPMLVRGSFQVHSGMLMYYCSRAKTSADFTKCYNIGKEKYNQLIKDAFNNLLESPLALDDTMALR